METLRDSTNLKHLNFRDIFYAIALTYIFLAITFGSQLFRYGKVQFSIKNNQKFCLCDYRVGH